MAGPSSSSSSSSSPSTSSTSSRDMSREKNRSAVVEHVIMLPFMAQGHIIPFVALALDIEKRRGRNCKISLINTQLNLEKIRSCIPPESRIRFRRIRFDSTEHGLPPNTENTDALPYYLIFRMMSSTFSLEPEIRRILSQIIISSSKEEEKNVVFIMISDIFFSWAGRVAREMAIFHAVFAATSAFGWACYYSLWSNVPNWKKNKNKHYCYSSDIDHDEHQLQNNNNNYYTMDDDFPEGGIIYADQMPPSMAAADGTDEWSLFQRKILSEYYNSDCLLFNTVEELDRTGLGYFRRKMGSKKPVYAIGPILLLAHGQNQHLQQQQQQDQWLDSKPARSVLYVCFGSQNTLSSSQMVEMAKALEAACERSYHFIWVLRPPLGHHDKNSSDEKQWLPDGFIDRVTTRSARDGGGGGGGLILRGWAPQLKILSHPSTGAFITHCGWNSSLEAITNGVPMIAWPMAGEQFFNVKFLHKHLGICVELARGNRSPVHFQDILDKIDMVMGDTQPAKDLRTRAHHVKTIMENARKQLQKDHNTTTTTTASSIAALDEFFDMANSTRRRRTTTTTTTTTLSSSSSHN